jgi:hypothetical protein
LAGNLCAGFGFVGQFPDLGAIKRQGESQPMNPSEKFLRFAAECELMAKFTRNPENRTVWTRMAERWLRCAQLYDREASAAHTSMAAKRHRTPTHSWAH